MTKRAISCQTYRNALMRLPEPTNGTELQNTEGSLKFLKHQWKSMRQPTTKNPTVVDNATTITITTTATTTATTMAKTTPRAVKTTATKENQPMAPRYSASSVLDQGKSSKSIQLLEENASNSEWYAEAKAAKSTAEFIKNRTGNLAHINEIELEVLTELVDHPIEHIINEINQFAFTGD